MNVTIEPVVNGFVIKALDGEHANEYVAQKDGKFTSDVLWAKLFTRKSDAETHAHGHNWTIK
ncbi:hypothetical protein M1271_07400 [Patescibacteria group bacterium]|nr:hypothetical protein [Patescibacteria group bacterium]MCL5797420.1 hypothetical protein [Patescibacteria group bacterium]